MRPFLGTRRCNARHWPEETTNSTGTLQTSVVLEYGQASEYEIEQYSRSQPCSSKCRSSEHVRKSRRAILLLLSSTISMQPFMRSTRIRVKVWLWVRSVILICSNDVTNGQFINNSRKSNQKKWNKSVRLIMFIYSFLKQLICLCLLVFFLIRFFISFSFLGGVYLLFHLSPSLSLSLFFFHIHFRICVWAEQYISLLSFVAVTILIVVRFVCFFFLS